MASDRVSLDEARDFLYTGMRAMERHTTELKAFVEGLDKRKASDEWLEDVEGQLEKGCLFCEQQLQLWGQMHERMQGYIASVRALADELAIEELSLAEKAMDERDTSHKQEARFIHPELHRFKLEKRAKIVGKYGGSPALGAMVMPMLAKEAILKATASPAAREIQYSKVEGKDAQYLAQVMRFKKEKKEEQLAAWQTEVEGKKGENFIKEQQAKGAKQEPSPHTPQMNKDLAERLAARQAQLEAEEERRAQDAAKAAATTSAAPKLTGELADKFQRRQQAEQDALTAAADAKAAAAKLEAERAEVEAELAAAKSGTSTATPVALPPGAHPMAAVNAQLSGVLKQRRVLGTAKQSDGGSVGAPATPEPSQQAEEASAATPPAFSFAKLRSTAATPHATPGGAAGSNSSSNGAGSGTAGMSPELLAKLQKFRKNEEDS